jgi:tetratricopeptide (TPR) repeat protein
LAKQRRGTPPRAVKKKASARKGPAPRSTRRTAAKAKSRPAARPVVRRPAVRTAKPVKLAKPARPQPPAPVPAPAPPAPTPRKPGFYEAVAIYERGVQALQRHDYTNGAELFRTVIDKYPEERELLERARLYLRVCERETARQAPPPQTAGDFVYAATVALNAGDHQGALGHLQRAISADAENDHAHYIMAAALSLRGRSDEALQHLQRSIALNPENRSQARQDPDLDNLRQHHGFRNALDTAPLPRRKATAVRRR